MKNSNSDKISYGLETIGLIVSIICIFIAFLFTVIIMDEKPSDTVLRSVFCGSIFMILPIIYYSFTKILISNLIVTIFFNPFILTMKAFFSSSHSTYSYFLFLIMIIENLFCISILIFKLVRKIIHNRKKEVQ